MRLVWCAASAIAVGVAALSAQQIPQVPNVPTPEQVEAIKKQHLESLKRQIDQKEAEVKTLTETKDSLQQAEERERAASGLEALGLGEVMGLAIWLDSAVLFPDADTSQWEALEATEDKLRKADEELTKLQLDYYKAGGPGNSSILKFNINTQDEEQKRLEEEYRALELKRKAEANAKPATGAKPTLPPISMSFDAPRWNGASELLWPASLSNGYVALNLAAPAASSPLTYLTFGSAAIDDSSQGQDALQAESDVPIVVEPAMYWPAQFATPSHTPPPRSRAETTGPIVAERAMFWTQQAADPRPHPSAKVFFTSLGGSTGETIQMTVVNDGNLPIRVASDGFALVPLAGVTPADVERELQKLAGLPRKTASLRAYCRDLRRPPPIAGRVLRLADASVQAQMAPFQRVLAASRRLLDAGVLRPDVDDRQLYLDSVRQWARWTMAEKFNERGFIAAFIEHTKKNTIAAGQKWERSFDGEARTIALERWRDVQRVLTEAQSVR